MKAHCASKAADHRGNSGIKMINVLFLPKWYPNKSAKTEGIFVRRHAEAVSSCANVHVLYAMADETLTKGFYHKENSQINPRLEETIYYYRKNITGIAAIDRAAKFVLYFLCMVEGYRQTKKSFQPQLLHVHVLLRTGLMALLFSWLDSIPFVYTEHWSGYHPQDGNYKGFVRKKLTQLFISKARCVMPVTEHLAKAMRAHGLKGNYQVIPNVVDTALFGLSDSYTVSSKIVAIHISNFDPRAKNVEGILDVMSLLKSKLPETKLLIVGDGQPKDALETKAKELGLFETCVFFTGPKMGSELVELIQAANFLFLFSHFENQPCVIMEAMACGKPILATHVGGIPEMVDETRGVLSPVGDVSSMAKNFEQMVKMLPSYNPLAIRQFALQHYSYETVGQQIGNVYQRALQAT